MIHFIGIFIYKYAMLTQYNNVTRLVKIRLGFIVSFVTKYS